MGEIRDAGVAYQIYSRENPLPDHAFVSVLELSVRSRRCLEVNGIETIGDLARCSVLQLMDTPNFGKKSLNEIREEMASWGRSLRVT